TNQEQKKFAKMNDIRRDFPDEPEVVAMGENKIVMPVSMPKCTVGIKESISELKGHDFVKKGLLQEMILSHYFSKGGSFYQMLYDENLLEQNIYYETNLDRNFG